MTELQEEWEGRVEAVGAFGRSENGETYSLEGIAGSGAGD